MLNPSARTFASWKDYHFLRPNSQKLNKLAVKIIKLTNPEHNPSDGGTWDEIKQNSNFIFTARNSFGTDVIFPHCISYIGGTIEDEEKRYVGLLNFTDESTPMCFQESMVSSKSTFNIPSLESMMSVSDSNVFKDLPASDLSACFRPLVALPPFIANALLRHQSSNPAVLGIVALSAVNSFNEIHKDDPSVDDTTQVGYYIASFFWAVANKHISNTISSPAIYQKVLD